MENQEQLRSLQSRLYLQVLDDATLSDEDCKKIIGGSKAIPYPDSYYSGGLHDLADQIRILRDMKDLDDFKQIINLLDGLFYHIDNPRYKFVSQGKECPEWYINKYRDKLS